MSKRESNLLGVLALAITDRLSAAGPAGSGDQSSATAALITIGSFPGQSIASLSTCLGLSHSATVRLIGGLVGRGLVTRQSQKDKRKAALSLTSRGVTAMRRAVARRMSGLSELLSPLSVRERETLTTIVEKLLRNATRTVADADRLCRYCDAGSCPQDRCPVECEAQRLRRQA